MVRPPVSHGRVGSKSELWAGSTDHKDFCCFSAVFIASQKESLLPIRATAFSVGHGSPGAWGRNRPTLLCGLKYCVYIIWPPNLFLRHAFPYPHPHPRLESKISADLWMENAFAHSPKDQLSLSWIKFHRTKNECNLIILVQVYLGFDFCFCKACTLFKTCYFCITGFFPSFSSSASPHSVPCFPSPPDLEPGRLWFESRSSQL